MPQNYSQIEYFFPLSKFPQIAVANFIRVFYFVAVGNGKLSDHSSLSALSDNCNINDSLDHTQWMPEAMVGSRSQRAHSIDGPQQLWGA